MAKKELNPGSAFDPWLGVPFLLMLSGPLARLIRPLLPANPAAAPMPPADGLMHWLFLWLGHISPMPPDDAVRTLSLIVMLAAIGVFLALRARAERSRGCRIIVGAFMALAGALVILVLSVALAATGLGLLLEVLPHWIPHPAEGFLLVVLCGGAFFLACYWSGWRYGARGPFWGAGAALLCLAAFILPAVVKGDLRVGAWEVAVALAAMLLGALAGTLGAARFQRGLAREAATAPGTAAPSTHPAA